jgi:hypothetical protein
MLSFAEIMSFSARASHASKVGDFLVTSGAHSCSTHQQSALGTVGRPAAGEQQKINQERS